ncbi:hypothetical protein [Brevibacillus dissolubilis]|uniref:hypothetical protein n=1 Tax=Brevibacillus dissolubilis TaxID=1844116 RepID=UPI00111698EA|nr:hypothetical protein [Brevibacillus dissolubilis]
MKTNHMLATLGLIGGLVATTSAQASEPAFHSTQKQIPHAEKTEASVTESAISAIENQELDTLNQKLKRYVAEAIQGKQHLTKEEKEVIKQHVKHLKDEYKQSLKNKLRDFHKKNGWVEVTQESFVTPDSSSSDLDLTDTTMYYSSSTGQYKYTGEFDFSDYQAWDLQMDTRDLMAVRSLNKVTVVSSYAKTYQEVYNEFTGETIEVNVSGYDDNGSVSGFAVTKRFENQNGVVWNIEDDSSLYGIPGGFEYTYDTDHGRGTLYFKKTSGTTSNKMFLDFEHNWKEGTWSGSASFSGVNLSGSSLSVSYTSENDRYQRTSTGKTF